MVMIIGHGTVVMAAEGVLVAVRGVTERWRTVLMLQVGDADGGGREQ